MTFKWLVISLSAVAVSPAACQDIAARPLGSLHGAMTTSSALVPAATASLPAHGGVLKVTGTRPHSIRVINQSVTTDAAKADQANLCPAGVGYPVQWDWDPNQTIAQPLSATMGTPRIEQWRAGSLIATYANFNDAAGCQEVGDGSQMLNPEAAAASGCGPFTRSHSYTKLLAGDALIVYPAVYTGPQNNPWIGPTFDSDANYSKGIFRTPTNITIAGFVSDNARPVLFLNSGASDNTLGQAPLYFDASSNITWDNVDVVSGPLASVGKAGVYVSNAHNVTLSHMRVSGFGYNQNGEGGANGVFGADGNSGTLLMRNVELTMNGGDNGPAHNAYIGASTTDPHFRVVLRSSWTHNARYGHDFKSRAPETIILDSYLEGGLPQPGSGGGAESYNLDDPNGGILVVKRSVLVKNASGPFTNGINLAYGMEGIPQGRKTAIDIENNTFVTFAKTFDGEHAIFPLSFFYPQLQPGTPGFPVKSVKVSANAFVGYCPTGNGTLDYRGFDAVVAGFSELQQNFTLAPSAKYAPQDTSVVGKVTYSQTAADGAARIDPTIGAMD